MFATPREVDLELRAIWNEGLKNFFFHVHPKQAQKADLPRVPSLKRVTAYSR